MILDLKTKVTSVIFLTVLFGLIDVTITKTSLLTVVLAAATFATLALTVVISVEKSKRVTESIPNFLNFMNLSMSTGKSLSKSFEVAIMYQKISAQPFYKYVFHRIFVLNNINSGLNFEIQQIFYKNVFQILKNNSQQRDKIKSLRLLLSAKIEMKRKEKSLRAPFKIQTYLFCALYFILIVWHFNTRNSFPQLEALSLGLFCMGLISSILVGKTKVRL